MSGDWQITPGEEEDGIAYAGGLVLRRGDQIDEINGHPVFEWWPIDPGGHASNCKCPVCS
jgi:hypothetical protein